jgi:hypothetical protein
MQLERELYWNDPVYEAAVDIAALETGEPRHSLKYIPPSDAMIGS